MLAQGFPVGAFYLKADCLFPFIKRVDSWKCSRFSSGVIKSGFTTAVSLKKKSLFTS